jgi:CDP-paratose 2-epimerase
MYAYENPIEDYDLNVTATLKLLENTSTYTPDSPFIFCSSSKVYGLINKLPNREFITRFDFPIKFTITDIPGWSYDGIREDFPLGGGDGRGMYGTNKAAADLLVQEYGESFGIKTTCLRGQCMTGAGHAGAELHGFLAYMARCFKEDRPYTIEGYKGKQLRDVIHSHDFANAIIMIAENPPAPGTVYNLGGGRGNSVSVLEAIELMEKLTGKTLKVEYNRNPRHGDHRIFVNDNSKFLSHYPSFAIGWSVEDICKEFFKPKGGAHVKGSIRT